MPSITKTLMCGLAAISAIQAIPHPVNNNPTTPGPVVAAPSATNSPPAVAPMDNTNLIKDLLTAPTAIKRFQRLLTAAGQKLLSADDLKKLVVFDFNGATPATGAKGGATKAANIESFPILTDLGISTTLAFLEPCGMNTPHIHPRATEFLTVVEGIVDFGYILENGLVKAGENAEISGRLEKYQGTVFPMGSVHYQVNPTCNKAVFVATLNSEDPGTSQIAQNFFGLNSDVVNATLGFPQSLDGKDIDAFRKQIPANLALGIDKCLQACNIKPNQ
ncbi:RmlC-like cupin [Delitschia confertaspora ATCC 74209]|uniref:RmlC-like cupin n=1 Tax=Delitschia confertaspora ATCC 74209 TaxID=1513339 RepID=A0A9P4JUZ9_9PLEO|nr:RmlC-like cupin [Delitschia confertaspora ATCC 74209]